MAAILLQWVVLDKISTTHHRSALTRSENLSVCSWATRMSPKSAIAARLVRALTLHQRICQAAPMYTLHVAVKANNIADMPPRSFRDGHRWNFPDDCDFLTHFTFCFPLPQGACWELFVINPKIVTLVTSVLRMQQLSMDVWKQLPERGRIFGVTGVGTQKRLALTLISPMKITLPLSERYAALLDGLGGDITDKDMRLLVQESRLQSGPSARPTRWTSTATLPTEPPSAT